MSDPDDLVAMRERFQLFIGDQLQSASVDFSWRQQAWIVHFSALLVEQVVAAALLPRWQEIETAPKDGTFIILFLNGNVYRGSWNLSASGVDGWRVGQRWMNECPPTHWMPLPALHRWQGTPDEAKE